MKNIVKDSLGWGFILWLIGYILGVILFFFVSPSLIGWIIMPIGIIITFWVLLKKVKSNAFRYYFILALVWTAIAIAFDYIFIVILLKPENGYYKPAVYLYYALTFIIPLIVGWWKNKAPTNSDFTE
jgi:hypothetical protein